MCSRVSSYINNVDSSINELLCEIKSNKRFALFVGAGVSINAGIPSGRDIIKLLIQSYPDKFKDKPNCSDYSQAFNLALPGEENKLERRSFIENLFVGKVPSDEHYLIAQLVEHKVFRTILTTNFDHQTEATLLISSSLHPRIYLYDDDVDPQEYSDEFPKLFKLHGDFLFDDLANLDREMKERLTENMRNKLIYYLKDCGLIVIGYGGKDETIMHFLEEAALSNDGIRNGLWWVYYNEEELKNDKLINLIKITKKGGKEVKLIGPIEAKDLLKKLCFYLNIPPAKRFPFGIKGKNSISFYLGRFGKPRQFPLIIEPKIPNADLPDALSMLEKALSTPGVLWLHGPPVSGKTALIGKLFAKFGAKKLFYFSPRFSRNPAHISLKFDLETFANAIGISTVKQYVFQDVIKSLFKKGVILVFDDLFLEATKMRRQLWELLIDIIAIQTKVGKGNIILVSSREPMENLLIEIYHGILEAKIGKGKTFYKKHGQITTLEQGVNKTLKNDVWRSGFKMKFHFSRNMISFWPRNYQLVPEKDIGLCLFNILDILKSNKFVESLDDIISNILKDGRPDFVKTLIIMSLLRFAEPAFILRQLVEIPQIGIVLNELVQRGVVENRGQKYVLRDKAQIYILKLNLLRHQDILELAKRFEVLSSSYVGRLDLLHYLSESENLYFLAGNYSKAVELTISLANLYMKTGNIDTAYSDLSDFMYQNKFISELTPTTQIEFSITFFKVWKRMLYSGKLCEEENSNATILFNTIASNIISALPLSLQYFFEGRLAYENGDLNKAIKYFLKAEKVCLKQGPSQELIAIQSGLSEAFIEQFETQFPINQESIKKAHRFARKARATCLKINDLKKAHLQTDNIATCLFKLKKYEKALPICEEARTFISKHEGLTRDKGVVYGNLFSIHLAISNKKREEGDVENAEKHAKQAEGFFFESNLNFAYVSDWEGLIRNFASLFQFVLMMAPKDAKGRFPTAFQVYRGIYEMWFWAPQNTFDFVWKATLIWSDYNINHKQLKNVVYSLGPFLKLAHFIAREENEKEAIKYILYHLTRIQQAFADTIIKSKILPIIFKSAPGQPKLYECYYRWLNDSQLSLEQLFRIYKISPEWEQVMKEVRNILSRL